MKTFALLTTIALASALVANGLFLLSGHGDIDQAVGFLCIYAATRVIKVQVT